MSPQVNGFSTLRAVVVSYHLMADGTGRPNYVAQALGEMAEIGSVSLVASDFDHITKRTIPADGAVRVPVRPYAKNISMGRVFSYVDFAWQVNHVPEVVEADLVYICVPDYLSALAILRKKRDRRFVVIVDIVDLWPEAFPLPKLVNGLLKDVFGFTFKPLRQRLFQKADLVLFQSRNFLKQFGNDDRRYGFLPMCLPRKSAVCDGRVRAPIMEEVRLLFLGSMNSITDIESLIGILCMLAERRKVCLSIVGGGLGLESLQRRLSGTAVRLVARGITFDRQVREEELARAHFGFNGYKKTTEVSVSYKALDYLQNGLPIINCTKVDLTNLVNDSGCGFNYEPNEIEALVEKILLLSVHDHQRMSENACRAFEGNYSYGQFRITLGDYIRDSLKKGANPNNRD